MAFGPMSTMLDRLAEGTSARAMIFGVYSQGQRDIVFFAANAAGCTYSQSDVEVTTREGRRVTRAEITVTGDIESLTECARIIKGYTEDLR